MFECPHGIFIDKDSHVWATDERVSDDKKIGAQIFKFSPDGKVLLTLDKTGTMDLGPDTFGAPSSTIQAANGDLFIADGHDHCDCPNAAS